MNAQIIRTLNSFLVEVQIEHLGDVAMLEVAHDWGRVTAGDTATLLHPLFDAGARVTLTARMADAINAALAVSEVAA